MEHEAHHSHTSDEFATAPGAEAVVTLTEKAVEMAKEARAREGLGDDSGLRVGVIGGGCSGFQYSLGFEPAPKADDQVIEQGGIRLFVDSMSVQYLKGITIDYVSGLHGAGFKFLNPNATRTCGCGSSFSA
ncbi:MAG: iron-sulfur cluster assembly accessory protein [Deltaproteobacteria bacterium]|nr:iron-sulfur cluster assembly accessory protein [Deltaproteobacteria bacterium]MBI3389943.1 iron-sulfur cluster assembly accessory protein [Deltaproteobacteria bacterium]